MVMREQVLQGFQEQRALVDALTNVSIPSKLNQLSLYFTSTLYHLPYEMFIASTVPQYSDL